MRKICFLLSYVLRVFGNSCFSYYYVLFRVFTCLTVTSTRFVLFFKTNLVTKSWGSYLGKKITIMKFLEMFEIFYVWKKAVPQDVFKT